MKTLESASFKNNSVFEYLFVPYKEYPNQWKTQCTDIRFLLLKKFPLLGKLLFSNDKYLSQLYCLFGEYTWEFGRVGLLF